MRSLLLRLALLSVVALQQRILAGVTLTNPVGVFQEAFGFGGGLPDWP